jgi:5-formyltetrahydrofolate cyclo-ligase
MKAPLRKKLIKQRCQIPDEVCQQRSHVICDRLSTLPIFQQAQNILAYTSFRREPDLSALWQNFPDKNWGFSRCVGQDLVWHQVTIADFDIAMRSGTYGILEPDPNLPLMDLAQVYLILIAAVACDRRGYRLGYGGGFYDRWLPHARGEKIGVVFDEFYLEELPNDPWDVKLDAIVTELTVKYINLNIF